MPELKAKADMRIALFLYILFLGTSVSIAQTKGTVVDGGKGQALPGVNIYLQKDSTGIGITDRKGEFRISHHKIEQADTLVFSYVGYLPFKCTLPGLQYLNNKVILHEHSQPLHEVVVQGEHTPFFLEWTWLKSLPKPLYSFGGFLHNGKIYVVAGDETIVRKNDKKHKQGTEAWEYHSRDMYVYDIAADEWTRCTKGLVPRAGHTAQFYKGTNTMRIYELATLDMESAGLYYWNNTLYMVGGCTRNGIYVAPHKGVVAVDVSQINQ